MRTFALILLIICAGWVSARAQHPTAPSGLSLPAPHFGKMPLEVQTAVQQDFPGAVIQRMDLLPTQLYYHRWAPWQHPTREGKRAAVYYELETVSPSVSCTAVYDKTGQLISLYHLVPETLLPAAVQETLGKKFTGWSPDSWQEKITYKTLDDLTAYRIKLTKAHQRQEVFVDGAGKITRVSKHIHAVG